MLITLVIKQIKLRDEIQYSNFIHLQNTQYEFFKPIDLLTRRKK